MKKILIVEDDEILRNEVKQLLEGSGYRVLALTSFQNVTEQILERDPDLVLLDVVLPGTNGQTVLRELRMRSGVPLIMLTSRDGEVDEIVSRSSGADDYVTKPYNPTLLLLRIEGLLRRSGGELGEERLQHAGIELNLSRSSVTYQGKEWILSKNEARILYCLMKKKGRIVSRDELMDALWDMSEFVDDNTLSVNVNRLRRRLAELGLKDVIETRRGQGYLLTEQGKERDLT